ncbi:Asp-tRNA(Asn)/Glu-tRNA(Gln) amidotransferase subunit GatC [Candidatus Woesearchaeota archaeon]|nr:Asp-tRNA(Asn)/Glu-tRNA(Gln) amidotransferase subunit GatC [Candidatus Woesearchaeota archaeon]
MKVDEALLGQVARVARLALAKEEKERFVPQFKEILGSFQKLSAVDTSRVEPCFHPVALQGGLREDKPGICLSQEEALSNVRDSKDGFIKGPRAV